MKILIVDDHPMITEYLSGAAAKAFEGAQVRTADDLDSALIVARGHRPSSTPSRCTPPTKCPAVPT